MFSVGIQSYIYSKKINNVIYNYSGQNYEKEYRSQNNVCK